MNEKLLMTIGLIDQVTKPLQGITKDMQGAMATGKSGLQDMATGGAGVVAAGMAIQNALMPAIEMDRKLGEVKSLGVTDEALKKLSHTAFEFASEYGKSATDFVAASYDIQSAIAGLDGNELAQFTQASGVLAAATKADTSTITAYMGTMYGIFKNQAAQMGKGEWVEQVAGQTATAVQMFKTTGAEMSRAFTSVGANATSAGVAMSEQMAILGTLQSTMSGSEAGTKYKSFLAGVGNAQTKLGLKFTDSEGKMLPMLDILAKLKTRFGDTLDVAESDALKTAFGSDEAVGMIKLLMADTDGLASSIDQLGQVTGMGKAEQMASAMTDQWERLEASWFAIRAAAYGMVLPAINSIAGAIADGLTWLTSMTDEYPLLTQMMSYASIAALALGGVVSSLSLIIGIGRMMSAGWAVTMGTLGGVMKLLRLSTLALTATTWLFNAALWANPITWVVAGIVALVAVVGAMIYWWDDLKASFGDLGWFQTISAAIDGLIEMLNLLPGVDIEWRASGEQTTKETQAVDNVTKNIPKPVNAATTSETTPSVDTSVIDYKKPENAPKLNPTMVQNLNRTQHPQTQQVRQYGDVHITTQNGFTPDQLEEWRELNAG
ncbi:phage tail tape measure protein [Vibrio tritonius]|uniref:phage tail tape measure protein n=1 Tax=Vibrio tritonius TaxID=1435069 RepID=UPI00315D3A08